MSNPTTFIDPYTQNIVEFCKLMQTLRSNNDQLAQDPTLIDRYFAQTNPSNPNIVIVRTDITAQDVTNAQSAIVQMLFAFDRDSMLTTLDQMATDLVEPATALGRR